MKDGPVIARIAALIGDPTRADMLTALMDGRALTAGELAAGAGVSAQTASGHLAKLAGAGLLAVEVQGRHRYHRLSGPDVAAMLETIMGLAQRTGAVPHRPGPRDAALREARICYDHLAGERGVHLHATLLGRGWIEDDDRPRLTAAGRTGMLAFGIDLAALEAGRRPVCRHCLDWSERRHHLAGALGAALLEAMLARHWARRGPGRVIAFTPPGARAFAQAFGTEPPGGGQGPALP